MLVVRKLPHGHGMGCNETILSMRRGAVPRYAHLHHRTRVRLSWNRGWLSKKSSQRLPRFLVRITTAPRCYRHTQYQCLARLRLNLHFWNTYRHGVTAFSHVSRHVWSLRIRGSPTRLTAGLRSIFICLCPRQLTCIKYGSKISIPRTLFCAKGGSWSLNS